MALAVGVVVADQLSKHWAVNRLRKDQPIDDRTIDLIGSLRFNLAFNKGMAFSQGQGLGPLIAVVATVVIVWLLISLRTTAGRLNTFGIGCVIGGAAGNLIDRAFRQEAWLRGGVVDFIDLQWFPIFNLADSAINVGAAALILNAILGARRAASDDALSDGAATSDTDIDAADSAASDPGTEPDAPDHEIDGEVRVGADRRTANRIIERGIDGGAATDDDGVVASDTVDHADENAAESADEDDA